MGIVINQSIKNTVFTYLGFLLGAFNVLFLYTYFLSDEYHGLLAFIISTATIMMPFISLGVHNAIIRFYSSFNSKLELNSFMTSMTLIPLINILIVISIGLTSMNFISSLLPDNDYINKVNIWAIIIMAASLSYFEVFYSLVKVKLDSVFGNFLKEIFHRVCIFLLIFLIHFNYINEQGFIISVVFVFFLRTIIMMIYAFQKNKFSFYYIKLKKSNEIYNYLFIICLAGAVANTILEVDKFMIGKYLEISEVAYYAVAIYICSIITVPRRALFQIANPLSSKLLNENNFKELDILYKKSSLNLLIICGLVFLLITINLSEIYSFLPDSYNKVTNVIYLISFTKLFNAYLGNIDGIIFNSKYYSIVVFVGVLITAVTIYLNYLLIPTYGLEGAAFSSFIAFCIYNTFKLFIVSSKFNLNPFTKKTFLVLVLIFVCFIFSLNITLNFNVYLNIIIQTLVLTIFYFFIVVYFNLSEDINKILSLLYNKKTLQR